MPSAYIDVSRGAVYLPLCPHCEQRAYTAYEIAARGSRDLLFGDYLPPLMIGVPVCAAAAKRRKRLGGVVFAASLLFVIVGAFVAMELGFAGYTIAAGGLGVGVAALALTARMGWDDALLDSWTLGVRARRVRGSGTVVRMTFRRDEYFSQWLANNPGASLTGAIGWRAPAPRDEIVVEDPLVRSRVMPAIVLAACALIVALHHWHASTGGDPFVVALSIVTGIGALALGGLVYPPVFWSMGAYGKHLPKTTKFAGALLAIAGLAGGFLLAISYRR